ncbi:MAG: hypothetical protein WBA07_30845 [Rivularia sp. (in: cyanobacteria)]
MNDCTETLQGYVVDIICIRKYPQNETVERARAHKRDCALAGHCAESGFGLIDEEGKVALLDPKATLQVRSIDIHLFNRFVFDCIVSS